MNFGFLYPDGKILWFNVVFEVACNCPYIIAVGLCVCQSICISSTNTVFLIQWQGSRRETWCPRPVTSDLEAQVTSWTQKHLIILCMYSALPHVRLNLVVYCLPV